VQHQEDIISVENTLMNTVDEYMVASFDKWLINASVATKEEPREPPGSFRYCSQEHTSAPAEPRRFMGEEQEQQKLKRDSADNSLLGAIITGCMTGSSKAWKTPEPTKKAVRPIDVPRPGGGTVIASAEGFLSRWLPW
jgi:hypothetical protein